MKNSYLPSPQDSSFSFCRNSPETSEFARIAEDYMRPTFFDPLASVPVPKQLGLFRTDEVCLVSMRFGEKFEVSLDEPEGSLRDHIIFHFVLRGKSQIEFDEFEPPHFVDKDSYSLHLNNKPSSVKSLPATQLLLARFSPRALCEYISPQINAMSKRSVVHCPNPKGEALFRYLEFLAQELITKDNCLTFPSTSDLSIRMLGRLLRPTLATTQFEQALNEPTYLLSAKAYILARFSEQIMLSNIVTASGASERTLHRAFQQHLGKGPLEYLRDVRLQNAHDILSKAKNGETTVTDTSYRVGFNHLSRFAHFYAEKFGERPSETLKTAKYIA